MTGIDFMAGFLARKKARHMLEALKFHGFEIEWIEQKRLFESSFIVKGTNEALDYIKKWVDSYESGKR